MKILKSFKILLLAGLAAAACSTLAHADLAGGVVRKKVAGIDLIVYRTNVKDVVTMTGSLPAGDAFAGTGNVAVPTLVGMMLDKGTTRQNKFQIAAQMEKAGAGMHFGVDSQLLTVGGRMLKKDLPMMIGLLAEQLRSPAFDSAELTKAKSQFIGGLRQALEDPESMASETFALAVFPQGHPNRPVPTREYIDATPRVTVAELKAFHARHYGPAHMTLVFVGDVDPAQIESEVARTFGGWSGGVDIMRAAAAAPKSTAAREVPVRIAGKTSVNILIGQASGMDYHHPDAIALRVGTAILGSGFTGRLMGTVRDKEGLTYSIGASAAGDTFNDGMWMVSATFAPDLLDKGLTSTRRELQKWWKDGVTAEELKARKTNMIGAYQVGLATTGGMAAALLRAANLGYEMTWLDEYPKRIDALSLEQVNAAIRKHLDPGGMVLVKAGTLDVSATAPAPQGTQ